MPQLLDVSHVLKRGYSLQITVPRKVTEMLDIKGEDILEFYEENGKIVLRKMD